MNKEALTTNGAGRGETSRKILTLVRLAVLTAVIILMAFTPIGYLKAGTIEITFLAIPVIIGAVIMGPFAGAFLGTVFGVTSFIQCFGMSAFGAMLLSINPIYAFIVCVFPRLLMGWLTGLTFKLFHAIKPLRFASYSITSLLGSLYNTGFFMTALIALYRDTDYLVSLQETLGAKTTFSFFFALAGINALAEAAVCLVVGFSIGRILAAVDKGKINRSRKKAMKEADELAKQNEELKSKNAGLAEATKFMNDNLKAETDNVRKLEKENGSLKNLLAPAEESAAADSEEAAPPAGEPEAPASPEEEK